MTVSFLEIEFWFECLDRLLHRWRPLWQLHAFEYHKLPWGGDLPDLERRVNELSRAEIQALDMDPEGLEDALCDFTEEFRQLVDLPVLVPESPESELTDIRLDRGVKRRKRAQVRAFAAVLGRDRLPVLEWCSGKGHLGRLVNSTMGVPVVCLERDGGLCDAGRRLASSCAAEIEFHKLDVMGPSAPGFVEAHQHAIALHACGELHVRLLDLASDARCRRISVAPCCYHRIKEPEYRPLSSAGRSATTRLSRFDLKMPQQEAVTARPRDLIVRERERTWRLGFDMLQREISGNDAYLHVPSSPGRFGDQGFEGFCRWAAERKHVEIPDGTEFNKFESIGGARNGLVARLELVRHLFRRPLECWLLLDRALYLRESGYQVALARFCPRAVTPRNVLLTAQLPE